ncbi:glutathione S-transferase family protein [Emcibacter sp.]|uniref:glutathione S-transferase family protein n=1 Tax=Emcibacter sp. TaxID=1979954 RepID=UPI003A93EDCC
MTEQLLALYFAPGTCARVCLTALEETGVAFETRLIAFGAGDHRSPEFLKINPAGKVPALVTRDGVITQNGAILQYLSASFPEAGLLPVANTPYEDAILSGHLFHLSSDLHPLVTRFVMPHFMCGVDNSLADIRQRAQQSLSALLAPTEEKLAQQDWLIAEEWSIMDSYLAWVWFRITGAGFPGDDFPALSRHYEKTMARPSARRAAEREAAAYLDLESRGLTVPLPYKQ